MLEGGKGLWSLPTLRAATSDQNGHLPGRPWGLGWAVRGQSISCHIGFMSCNILASWQSLALFGYVRLTVL